jgi:hypothetical protein
VQKAPQGYTNVNYCPLCAAEYKEGVSVCSTCGATLVPRLDTEAARANPPRLLWIGTDPAEFDIAAGALRDVGIPALVEESAAGILGRFLNSESQICVLQADFERALSVAADAITRQSTGRRTKQTCHACNAQCSVGLTHCPACTATLIVERETKRSRERHDGESRQRNTPTEMKYCPLCDAESAAAHSRCSVCGIALVPEELRGSPLTEKDRNERIEVVFRGGDPNAVSEVVAILREAGIRHHVQASSDHLVFELGMPRPKYSVRVFASDEQRARELLADICESAPFGIEAEPRYSPADLPTPSTRTTRNWNIAAATAEVWSGDDAALANLLEECFFENKIGVRRAGIEPGTLRLLVVPADESSAREIVHEVIHAAPPE